MDGCVDGNDIGCCDGCMVGRPLGCVGLLEGIVEGLLGVPVG